MGPPDQLTASIALPMYLNAAAIERVSPLFHSTGSASNPAGAPIGGAAVTAASTSTARPNSTTATVPNVSAQAPPTTISTVNTACFMPPIIDGDASVSELERRVGRARRLTEADKAAGIAERLTGHSGVPLPLPTFGKSLTAPLSGPGFLPAVGQLAAEMERIAGFGATR